MLIFGRDIVLAYPDNAPRSELMPNFDGIYLGKKYGVRAANATKVRLFSRTKDLHLHSVLIIQILEGGCRAWKGTTRDILTDRS